MAAAASNRGMHRRSFGLTLLAAPAMVRAQSAPRPARLDDGLVLEFVTKAHQRKIEPMKELIARQPALLNASWDWGGGDWENALEAAAHTGSREMALFLLEQGARLNLFAAAMLGDLETVRAGARQPGFAATRGAHGIPLLSHAIAGAEAGRPVIAFLLEKGADVNARHLNGMTPLMMAAQTGQRDTLRLLLAKGAEPNARAENGKTALRLSLDANHQEIAQDLREAGASF